MSASQPDDLRARLRWSERALADALSAVRGQVTLDVLVALRDRADARRALGRLEEALDDMRVVVAGLRRQRGDRDLDTLAARFNLAHLLCEVGRPEEALPEEEEALDGFRSRFGDAHPETLTARNARATTLRTLGHLAEALAEQDEVLAGRRRLLGPTHPDTIRTRNNRAETLLALDCVEEAHQEFTELLPLLRRGGAEALLVQANLATALWALGHEQEALAWDDAVMRDLRVLVGEGHPSALLVRANRAEALLALGRYKEALGEFIACVAWLDAIRHGLSDSRSREGWRQRFAGVLGSAIEVAREVGDVRLVVELCEAARAQGVPAAASGSATALRDRAFTTSALAAAAQEGAAGQGGPARFRGGLRDEERRLGAALALVSDLPVAPGPPLAVAGASRLGAVQLETRDEQGAPIDLAQERSAPVELMDVLHQVGGRTAWLWGQWDVGMEVIWYLVRPADCPESTHDAVDRGDATADLVRPEDEAEQGQDGAAERVGPLPGSARFVYQGRSYLLETGAITLVVEVEAEGTGGAEIDAQADHAANLVPRTPAATALEDFVAALYDPEGQEDPALFAARSTMCRPGHEHDLSWALGEQILPLTLRREALARARAGAEPLSLVVMLAPRLARLPLAALALQAPGEADASVGENRSNDPARLVEGALVRVLPGAQFAWAAMAEAAAQQLSAREGSRPVSTPRKDRPFLRRITGWAREAPPAPDPAAVGPVRACEAILADQPGTRHFLAFGRASLPESPEPLLEGPAARVERVRDALSGRRRGRPGLLAYVGHAVSGESGLPGGAYLALHGGLEPGHPERLYAGQLIREGGIEVPEWVLLLGCSTSGAETGAEWLGLAPAFLWRGARSVLATCWPTLDCGRCQPS